MTHRVHKEAEPGDLPPDLAGHLLEMATEAILLVDSHMRIIGVNGHACTILGFSKPELVGRDLPGLIPTEYHDGFSACTEAIARGETSRGQHGMWRKDGSMVMVEFSARRIPGGNVLGVVRDVSERVRADAELRRHKDFIEKIVESTADGIVAIDTEKIVTLFNPAFERITGIKAEQVLGRNAYDLFPFLLDVGEDELIDAALQGRITEARNKTFTVPQTGREGRYESRYSPLRDENGKITGAIGIVRDVTERDELQQRLLHAQKIETAGRLAGGIAHDFNNVLTVIIGEVALSLGPRWNEEKAREALRRIGEAAERAASITRQLLAFSRRNFASATVFTLDELVDGIRPMLTHLVGEGMALNIVHASGSTRVRADRGHLEQVLANLIVNARDAMPHGGTLTIETRMEHMDPSSGWRLSSLSPGECAVLSVTDTGIGMDEQVKSKLFEPFFTTKPNGTGLGLCSCLGLLQANGGDIAVESSIGAGTTVRVCLPLSSRTLDRPHFVSERVSSVDDLPRGMERILLVEDEIAVRNVTAEMLRALGYSVYEAENGVAALAYLEHADAHVDLVLSDVVMPQMGGRELMERIRSRNVGVRILLMTGYTEDGALRERFESDGLPILEKPFTQRVLALKVRAVLEG